ncbi:MAG: TPMT family class I SAM-dependent methyltransferase [Bacteroidota bacterium]|nr:TPMT family class I SAM-dependent methyltransferase [Bacteroidota bacterium]MDX5431223.1 TPMT family class I SAM-dependent methyltransferase [Bacteroidota bacterium]MDX5469962.1 TPMT family class I SAM-dependent methyltransferase [Bacteroidota bacterium]
MNLDASYWDERYRQHQTGWDLGEASPALTAYFDLLSDKDIRILIPGCGNAYEADYLLSKGFSSITVLDISPVLADSLRDRWMGRKEIRVVCDDFFNHEETYDLIVEQTFFCALHPSHREAYAKKMSELLRPNGKLIGVLFSREFMHDGPPFGGSATEYKELFSQVFHEVNIEPCLNSIAPRMGTEVFIQLSDPVQTKEASPEKRK